VCLKKKLFHIFNKGISVFTKALHVQSRSKNTGTVCYYRHFQNSIKICPRLYLLKIVIFIDFPVWFIYTLLQLCINYELFHETMFGTVKLPSNGHPRGMKYCPLYKSVHFSEKSENMLEIRGWTIKNRLCTYSRAKSNYFATYKKH
jgi:hypothetical protein